MAQLFFELFTDGSREFNMGEMGIPFPVLCFFIFYVAEPIACGYEDTMCFDFAKVCIIKCFSN